MDRVMVIVAHPDDAESWPGGTAQTGKIVLTMGDGKATHTQ